MKLGSSDAGDWYVFETIVADGTWSIGIGKGSPDPQLVMVVTKRLSRSAAEREAQRLAEKYGREGRSLASAGLRDDPD